MDEAQFNLISHLNEECTYLIVNKFKLLIKLLGSIFIFIKQIIGLAYQIVVVFVTIFIKQIIFLAFQIVVFFGKLLIYIILIIYHTLAFFFIYLKITIILWITCLFNLFGFRIDILI
jgi:hypothetical protein